MFFDQVNCLAYEHLVELHCARAKVGQLLEPRLLQCLEQVNFYVAMSESGVQA